MKRICRIVNFAVPAVHRVKIKEIQKRDKYFDLAREIKKNLWKMRVTAIPIDAFGTIPKRIGKRIGRLGN